MNDYKTKIKRILKKIYHYGKKYNCPFCKSNLSKMNAFGFHFPVLVEKQVVGGGWRLNARCPICNSIDRERLIYLYLRNNTDFFKKSVYLLHVAPEKRLQDLFIRYDNIRYLSADLYSEDVMVNMDITDIQYADNLFDFIICNHVLEHIIDDNKAISELFRVLKPGANAILQVPISLNLEHTYEDFNITGHSERESAYGQYDHVRIYAIDYMDRLRNAGFMVDTFCWWDAGPKFGNPMNKFALLKDETIFIAHKPK